MSFTGTVENGVVKLPPDVSLPEGAKVRVESLEPEADPRALVEELRSIARSMPELPPDWAAQHDHYLYGTPKR
jgi:predicted DNA-binding antitoxin AbrB/MazE fold protein